MQINNINNFSKSTFGARFASHKDEVEFVKSLKLKGYSQSEIAKILQDIRNTGSPNTRISKPTYMPVATVSLIPEYHASQIIEIDDIPKGLDNAEKNLIAKTMSGAAEVGDLWKMNKRLVNDYPNREDFILTLSVDETLEELNVLARLRRLKNASTIRKLKDSFSISGDTALSPQELLEKQEKFKKKHPILAKLGFSPKK